MPSAVVVISAIIGGIYLQGANNDTIQGDIESRKLKLEQEVLQDLFSISDTIAQRNKLEDVITAGFLKDDTKKYSLMFYDTAFVRFYKDKNGCFEYNTTLKEFDLFDSPSCTITKWLPTHRKIFCGSALGQNFQICVNDSGFSKFSFDVSSSNYIDKLGCTLEFTDTTKRKLIAEIHLPPISIPASNVSHPKAKTLIYLVYSDEVAKFIRDKGYSYVLNSCQVNTRWSCE